MTELAALESKFRRLAELRVKRDEAKKASDTAENNYREYEAEILETLAESAVKGSLEFDFGGDLGVIRFQPRSTIYGKIIDKNAALESFEEEALIDEMTGPKIESRRLNEYVRDKLEARQNLPAGVGYYERKFVTISRK